ncbi:restriction endonuclease subunit S [Cronobacter turicensis]
MAKYKAYPEYKDSGVEWLEEVPSHWEILSAKRMFQSVRTPAYKSDEQLAASQKYGVIPQSLMMQLNDSKVMLALKGTESFRHVETNNFVISLRSFEGGIEYSQYTGCVSPAYTVLKNSKPISYGYYRYLLKCKPFIAALQSSTDSLRDGKSINYEQFSALDLPLSSVHEQNIIASFLDHETAKIDNLIEKQQQLIELLKEKRQAVISHVVIKGLNPDVPMKDSGIEWLGEVPEHWVVTKLKYLISIFEQGWSPQCEARLAEEYEYGVLKVGCVNSGEFNPLEHKALPSNLVPQKQYLVKKNDLLISRANTKELVGSSAVIEKDYGNLILCDKLYRLRFRNSINPYLISEFIRTPMIRKQIELSASGASHSMQNIGQDTIKELFIALPPENEALQLVAFIKNEIDVFDSLIGLSNRQVVLLQERRTALISAAVTGKIDVRDWVAPDTQDVEEPQEATA